MEVVLSSRTQVAQHGDLMLSWACSRVQANLWRHHGRDAEGKLPTRQVRVNKGPPNCFSKKKGVFRVSRVVGSASDTSHDKALYLAINPFAKQSDFTGTKAV